MFKRKNSTQKHAEQEHFVMIRNLIKVCPQRASLNHTTTDTTTLTSEHIYKDSSGKWYTCIFFSFCRNWLLRRRTSATGEAYWSRCSSSSPSLVSLCSLLCCCLRRRKAHELKVVSFLWTMSSVHTTEHVASMALGSRVSMPSLIGNSITEFVRTFLLSSDCLSRAELFSFAVAVSGYSDALIRELVVYWHK